MEALVAVIVFLCVIFAVAPSKKRVNDDGIYEPVFDSDGEIKIFRKVRR